MAGSVSWRARGMQGFKKPVFLKKAQPGGFLGFIGFFGYWILLVFCRGFKVWVASAKCYSHQVNPKMENCYCVFIVNYVYCLCRGTVLILWKLQLNLQTLDGFQNCKIAKHVIEEYNAIRFRVGFLPFLGGCTQ